MDFQTLGNDLLDLLAGIQAGHRVLEDHLHIRTQIFLILRLHIAADVTAVEDNLPGCRGIQADQGSPGCGLSRTGFTDQAVRFTRVNIKTDAVHRLGGIVPVDAEVLFQVFNMKKWFTCFCLGHIPSFSFLIFSMRSFNWSGISTFGARGSQSQLATRCWPPTLNIGGSAL